MHNNHDKFQIISKHIDFEEATRIYVSNTFFYLCCSQLGGAFYSSLKVHHVVEHCFFGHCNSTDESDGRGGAFLIISGSIEAKFCCTECCNSRVGSDVAFYGQFETKFDYIQTFHSINRFHGLWISSSSNSHFKNMNITHSFVQNVNNGYANALNLWIREPPEHLSFINCIRNSRAHSLLEIERSSSKTIPCSFLNFIGNTEHKTYFSFQTSPSSCIIAYNSTFIGNDGNDFFYEYKSTGSSVQFHGCSFSISKPTTIPENIEILNDCLFDQDLEIIIQTNEQCYLRYFFSCERNRKFKLYPSLLFIYFLFNFEK